MLLFYTFRIEQTEVHQNSNRLKKSEKFKSLVDYERQLFEPNPNFMEELNNIINKKIQLYEDEEKMEIEEETETHKEFQNMLQNKT